MLIFMANLQGWLIYKVLGVRYSKTLGFCYSKVLLYRDSA